jgi:hypothetical protein
MVKVSPIPVICADIDNLSIDATPLFGKRWRLTEEARPFIVFIWAGIYAEI